MNKIMKKSQAGLMVLFFLVTFPTTSWCQSGFTQKDRGLLIQLTTKITEIDKRFEQIDIRFRELREDMNKRFEQIDKRFEQVDKRFEQVDKRFEQMMSFILILSTIFGAMTAGTIGFAIWDRRTMIRPFETKVSEIDKKIEDSRRDYKNLISFLKEYSSKNKKFSEIIQRFNLF